MPSTALEMMWRAPVNSTIILFCSGLFLYHWNRRGTYENVAISYDSVVRDRQWYRVVTSAVYHLNFLHLFFNMSSLYSVGVVEAMRGSLYYTGVTFLLLALTPAIMLGVIRLVMLGGKWADARARREGRLPVLAPPPGTGAEDPVDPSPLTTLGASMRLSSAVGYSGILFAWMTIMNSAIPGATVTYFFISIPAWAAPWVALLMMQCLIPNASFLGHLSGILAGYVVAWGLMDWVTPYWLWSSVLLWGVLLVASIGNNPALRPPSSGPHATLTQVSGWRGRAAYLLSGRCIRLSPRLQSDVGLGSTGGSSSGSGGGGVQHRWVRDGRLVAAGGMEGIEVVCHPDMTTTGNITVGVRPLTTLPSTLRAGLSSGWGRVRGAWDARRAGTGSGSGTGADTGAGGGTVAAGAGAGAGSSRGGGAVPVPITAGGGDDGDDDDDDEGETVGLTDRKSVV